MAEKGNTGRNSTLGSALIMLVLVILVIAVLAYVALNPDILENILYILIVAAVIIIATVVIIYIIAMVLAVPYYAMKGEEYQTSGKYKLEDIESVKESDSEKKKKDD